MQTKDGRNFRLWDSLALELLSHHKYALSNKVNGSRILDFTEFMDDSIKQRIKSGTLDWMDKLVIFETYYIPIRESEGSLLIKRKLQESQYAG
jgi:hypothetical protein